jgi:hypothetical protein
MVVHNGFVGGEDWHYPDGRVEKIRFEISEEDRAIFRVKGEIRRWSEANTSLIDSWEEIPQAKEVKTGDLILYRREGKIPNIHFFSPVGVHTSMLHVRAFPCKVDSVQEKEGEVASVAITETRFTSFRDPGETLRAFEGGDFDIEKAIAKMLKVGYLKKVSTIIPSADFRLFGDINDFLTKKFGLQLFGMAQEMEPFFPHN